MLVAVIGYGSIGKRHAQNIKALGHEVVVYDPILGIDEWQYLDFSPRVIAAPADGHQWWLEQAQFGSHAPAFVEKPVLLNMEEAERFMRVKRREDATWASIGKPPLWAEGSPTAEPPLIQVGYQLRFDRSLLAFRKSLPRNIASVRVWFSQRLSEWRPDRDYRTTPSAQKALGGGILREASHELDLIRFLFGEWVWVSADVRRASDLDIDVEDTVSALVGMEDFTITLNLDMTASGYRRGVEVVTREGQTASWEPDWSSERSRNQMYEQEMAAFLKSVETGVLHPNAATLEDGIEALRLVEACETSSKERRVVYNSRAAEVEGESMGRGAWWQA